MFFGSSLIMLFLVTTGQITLLTKLTPPQINWILVTTLFLLAYVTTWYHGLKYIKVSLATSILPLGGPTTSLLSLIFLDATPLLNQALGIVLIISGAVLMIGAEEVMWVIKSFKKLIYARA